MCNQHCHVFAAHTSIEGQHRWAPVCSVLLPFSFPADCSALHAFWPSGLLACHNFWSASIAAQQSLCSIVQPWQLSLSVCMYQVMQLSLTMHVLARQTGLPGRFAIIAWLSTLLHAGLSESSLLYHNNVLSLPLMASYMLTATNEVQTVRQYPQLNNIWFLVRQWKVQLLCSNAHPMTIPSGYKLWMCHNGQCWTPKWWCLQLFLGVSASQAFLLNLCIFRCTTINSPLATTITGTLIEMMSVAGQSWISHRSSGHAQWSTCGTLIKSACDCRTNEGHRYYRAWNDTVWGCTVQLEEFVRHYFGTARGYALLLLWLHGKTKTEAAAR